MLIAPYFEFKYDMNYRFTRISNFLMQRKNIHFKFKFTSKISTITVQKKSYKTYTKLKVAIYPKKLELSKDGGRSSSCSYMNEFHLFGCQFILS